MARPSDPPSRERATLGADRRIAAVVSTYHREVTEALFASARAELRRAGLVEEGLLRVDAPGAFEIPVLAQALAARGDVDAVLCLALVLKGRTRHDQVLADSVAWGLQQVALGSGKPVVFGVLTCETLEQARERALPEEAGGTIDKGREAARAAVAALRALEQAEGAGRMRGPAGYLRREG